MTRPDLQSMNDRRPRALHRTLPMWVRERRPDGSIEWRIYAPSRFGGALYAARTFKPGTSRATVAAALRFHRRIIWGRTSEGSEATPEPTPSPAHGIMQAVDSQLDLFGALT